MRCCEAIVKQWGSGCKGGGATAYYVQMSPLFCRARAHHSALHDPVVPLGVSPLPLVARGWFSPCEGFSLFVSPKVPCVFSWIHRQQLFCMSDELFCRAGFLQEDHCRSVLAILSCHTRGRRLSNGELWCLIPLFWVSLSQPLV